MIIFFICSFLSVRKERKEACSPKELLKLCFVPLRQNNSPDRIGVKQILSFTLHCTQFFNVILLMSEDRVQKLSGKEEGEK